MAHKHTFRSARPQHPPLTAPRNRVDPSISTRKREDRAADTSAVHNYGSIGELLLPNYCATLDCHEMGNSAASSRSGSSAAARRRQASTLSSLSCAEASRERCSGAPNAVSVP